MSEFPRNVTQGISYQVVSSLPGRIRLRIPSLLKNSTYQNTLRGLIAAIEGVTSVRINPLANSAIITFAEEKISPVQLEEELAKAISKAAPEAIAQAAVPQKAESKTANERPTFVSPHPPTPSPTGRTGEKQVPPSLEEGFRERENIPEAKVGYSQTAMTPKLGESKDERIPVTETVDKLLLDLPIQPAPSQQIEELPVNSWQQQCQEYAESIEKLQDRIAALKPVAAIGSAWLRRWYIHSPGTIDSSASASSFAPVRFSENPKTEAQWQELAAQQIQAIANIEQCLADLQRLAVIGEARLNKYRKYL